MNFFIFAVILFASLLMVPFGLPGIWVMVAAAVGYNILVPGELIGWYSLIGVTFLAFATEVTDLTLASRYARLYGGSKRAAWGAACGGIIGAIVGVPIPFLGSLIGAFAGAFAGALIAERLSGANTEDSARAAKGALIGRVVASALKSGIAVFIAVWLLIAAWN